MNWEIIESVSVFVAAVATLITLVYLARQVRDSNKLAKAAALQSVLEGFSDRTLALSIEHPEALDIQVSGHQSFDSLSPRDQFIFGGIINRDVFHMQNVMQLYDFDLVSDDHYDSWLAYTVAMLLTPGGRACWSMMKVSMPPTFVQTLDSYMASNPSAPSFIELYPQWYSVSSDNLTRAEKAQGK
jgi:hypothetical protein